MHAIPIELQDIVAGIQDENRRMKAELAALRPWAEIGKQAIDERWYWGDESGMCGCCVEGENFDDNTHDGDCPIRALLAELEAEA